VFDQANQIRPSGVLTHLSMVQDIHWAGPAGSSAFWSIPVEFHIYFFFLIVLALMRWRLGSWMPSVVALMALTVLATLLPSVPVLRWLGGLSPSLYALFIVGFAAAAAAAAGVEFVPRRWHAFLAAMFVLGCASILVCRSRYAPLSPLNDFLIGPVVALLITQLVRGRLAGVRRALGARFTVWLGDCSYSIYLIHAIVIEAVWRVAVRPVTTNPSLRLVLELVLGLTASILVGRAFYHAFERPFLRVNRRPAKPVAAQPQPAEAHPADEERMRRTGRQRPQRVPA
jgi:peptidoglycan/LPS O-acetylase OafA/YrhL